MHNDHNWLGEHRQTTASKENNQHSQMSDDPQPDAFEAGVQPRADQGRDQGTSPESGERALNPAPDLDIAGLSERDAAVLRAVVRLRLLTYEQLHRIAFADTDRSIARRRVRKLAEGGWLTTWEAPARHGGHERYAHPTAQAIRAILPTLVPDAPWRALIERMVPRSQRRPLELADHAPKWLAHQREVNHLLASIMTAPERRVLWASSWDCPFPSKLGMFTLPQPDYVLVEEVAGVPRLVFGEHDRGSEPVERFSARKIALYGALASFPDVCEEFFGLRSFRVHISVIDPLRRAPVARLRALMESARRSEHPDLFHFTLGGWLFASPGAPIWYVPDAAPLSDSVASKQHAPALHVG